MIDLRCHVLDGPGCGPKTFAESLAMCQLAAEDGVRTIVATPRWEPDEERPPIAIDACGQKLAKLEEELHGRIKLRLGFVMGFGPNLPCLVEKYGSSITLGGGRFVLVSIPQLRIPSEADRVWAELASFGYSTLLAKPECNPLLRHDWGRLDGWVSAGLVVQIDAASITGVHGREVQRFATQCLKRYEKQVVVASNMRPANARYSTLAVARNELTKRFGGRLADTFLNATPAAIMGQARRVMPNGQGQNTFAIRSILSGRTVHDPH